MAYTTKAFSDLIKGQDSYLFLTSSMELLLKMEKDGESFKYKNYENMKSFIKSINRVRSISCIDDITGIDCSAKIVFNKYYNFIKDYLSKEVKTSNGSKHTNLYFMYNSLSSSFIIELNKKINSLDVIDKKSFRQFPGILFEKMIDLNYPTEEIFNSSGHMFIEPYFEKRFRKYKENLCCLFSSLGVVFDNELFLNNFVATGEYKNFFIPSVFFAIQEEELLIKILANEKYSNKLKEEIDNLKLVLTKIMGEGKFLLENNIKIADEYLSLSMLNKAKEKNLKI